MLNMKIFKNCCLKYASKESYLAAELQKNTINLDNQEKEIDRANNAVEEIQIRINKLKMIKIENNFYFKMLKKI